MEKSRADWLKNLQKLLECPICYEIPKKIYFCAMGHNICEHCMIRISECPVCKKNYLNTRNFFAEHVSVMLNDIKKNIINEDLKKLDVSKIKIQDDLDLFTELGKTINHSWGKFPCFFKSQCRFHGCYTEIIEHFEKTHATKYVKILNDEMPLTRTHSFLYQSKKGSFNEIFHVNNVGLFVFHFNVNERGDLRILILIYASRSVAKKFSYRMTIKNNKTTWTYKTRKLFTTRTSLDTVYQGSFSIPKKDILVDGIDQSVQLECIAILKRQILR